jgi:hypothetical protein
MTSTRYNGTGFFGTTPLGTYWYFLPSPEVEQLGKQLILPMVQCACSRYRTARPTTPNSSSIPPSITGPGSTIGYFGKKEPRCASSFGKDATAEKAIRTAWDWTVIRQVVRAFRRYLPSCREVNSKGIATRVAS